MNSYNKRKTSRKPNPRAGAMPRKISASSRRNIILACLALLAGVLCVAYPIVSNALQQAVQGKVVSVQQEEVASTSEEDLSAYRQAAVDYNNRLLNGRAVVTDPFDPDAQRPTDEDYENVLNLKGDGVMGTITIPKIHVNLPIYHGTSDEVLAEGVGHLEGTSLPIGGESTHAVLSGHTGLPSMKIFDNLDQLEVGDYFVITVLGEDHAYRVTSTEVVLPDQTDSLTIQPGKDLVTLVTCTPYGVNTHRLLVHAERCEVPEEWLDKGDAEFPAGYSEPADPALLPSVLLGIALAAAVIGGYAAASKIRKRRAAKRAMAPGSQPTGVIPVSQRSSRVTVNESAPRPSRAVAGSHTGNRLRSDRPYRSGSAPGTQSSRVSRSQTSVQGSWHHPRPNTGISHQAAAPKSRSSVGLHAQHGGRSAKGASQPLRGYRTEGKRNGSVSGSTVGKHFRSKGKK